MLSIGKATAVTGSLRHLKEKLFNLQDSFKFVSIRTWLVLLELREWPISPAFCCCAIRFWLLACAILDGRSKTVISGVSDASLSPESVNTEETIDCGSKSCACWYSSPTAADFFFVNEPQPDEPEAMEASSLELSVCRLAMAFGLALIKPVGVGLLIRFSCVSGSVGNELGLEEGLQSKSKYK